MYNSKQFRYLILILLSVLVLGGAHSPVYCRAGGFLHVPPDSFIRYHVDSLAELQQQIRMDSIVRTRLARHFHMSGPAIEQYVNANLKLQKLRHAGTYRVFYVDSRGREHSERAVLPRHTPVFVYRQTGQPILKLACGNPLVTKLPKPHPRPVIKVKRIVQRYVSPPRLVLQPPTIITAPAPPNVITPEIIPPTFHVAQNITPPLIPVFTAAGHHGFGFVLPIVGAVLLPKPGGGGSTTPITGGGSGIPLPPPTGGGGTTLVPEPSSYAIWGIALILAGVFIAKRNSPCLKHRQ